MEGLLKYISKPTTTEISFEAIENYPGLRYSVCKIVEIDEQTEDILGSESTSMIANVAHAVMNMSSSHVHKLIKDVQMLNRTNAMWYTVYDHMDQTDIFRKLAIFTLICCYHAIEVLKDEKNLSP